MVAKKESAFQGVIQILRENVGRVITVGEVTGGSGQESRRYYLRNLARAGYLEPLDDGSVSDDGTQYRVVKRPPDYYTRRMLDEDVRIAAGYVVDHKSLKYI